MLSNVLNDITSAGYEGKSLIGNIGSSHRRHWRDHCGLRNRVDSARRKRRPIRQSRRKAAAPLILRSRFGNAINAPAAAITSTTAASYLTATGTFTNQQNMIGNSLNAIGSNINYVNNQTTYNNDKIDALNSGLGSLVDADLAKESAQLTALQIRQQLGTQALSLANQAPQTLLSLFK